VVADANESMAPGHGRMVDPQIRHGSAANHDAIARLQRTRQRAAAPCDEEAESRLDVLHLADVGRDLVGTVDRSCHRYGGSSGFTPASSRSRSTSRTSDAMTSQRATVCASGGFGFFVLR